MRKFWKFLWSSGREEAFWGAVGWLAGQFNWPSTVGGVVLSSVTAILALPKVLDPWQFILLIAFSMGLGIWTVNGFVYFRDRRKSALPESKKAMKNQPTIVPSELVVTPDSIKIKSKLGPAADTIRCQFANTTLRPITKCFYLITNLRQWSPEHVDYFVENFVSIAINGPVNLEPGPEKEEEITIISRQNTAIHIDGVRDGHYLSYSRIVKENSIWKLTLAVSSQDKFVREIEIFFKCLANRRFELIANPANITKPPMRSHQ